MKKRLFFYTTLIILAGLLCFFAASVYITYQNNFNIAKDAVIETARICAGLYSGEAEASAFVKVGVDTRITVISPEGAVLADSRPLDLGATENHLARPEIQAAAKGAPAAYVRHSETLGVDYIYYALKVEQGDSYVYIRTAIPVTKTDAYLVQSLPPLVLLLVAVSFLCFAFSRGMIRRITKPFETVERRLSLLSSGEYTSKPITGSYEEIDAIIRGIDEVAQVLQKSFVDLRDEKAKLDYVMANIGNALFVLDESRHISFINTTAFDVFSVNAGIIGKGMNYLTNEKLLVDTVRACVDHEEDAMIELVINSRIYLTSVKRLPQTALTMVVLSDVTESRENAKRREEFFANASHELKTPLTAIKGFSELTAIHNKDENVKKYIEGVARETDRMLSLISDMLRLSELENTEGTHPAPMSLARAVSEACEAVSVLAGEKAITLEAIGDGTVEAEEGHLYELVKNIIENAVRYSNEGGKVSVSVVSGEKTVSLSVIDDGVGISKEEQSRIFERFYRVEKSRSLRNGGTGLGLSIVKHICALYGWKLSLKSKLGVGTEVSVVFPFSV